MKKKRRSPKGDETTTATRTSVADAVKDKTAVLEKTTANARTIANAAVVTGTVVLATTPKGAVVKTEVHAKVEIVTVKAEIVTAKAAIADAVVAHKANDENRQANSPLSSPASLCDAGLFYAPTQTSFLPILSLPLALTSND